ncbi:hypothetical protein F8M41_016893 [Gigaspora margarita]|uniref:Yeast cell wall synthesis Kre9/Knh1-like N-terminal domain-containing protein n=1 Tax=Gigaspora margarita TaxID=4874 RepID=A0A8H4EML4_GIGMA|nr:hypothetical protein F8M41_016893 [Gigaspora margarita]
MKFTILLFVAGFLISVIYASIETLTPFKDVVWNGGDNEIIKWKENNNPPLLKDLKDVTIHLMAGGPDKQVEVGIIAEHVKGTKLSLKLNVPKKLGPSGPFYFIKYTSPSNTSYSDFSGFFTINGTTGTIPGFDPQATTTTTTSPTTTNSAVVQTQQPDNANNGATNNSTSTTNTNVAKNGAQNGVQSSPTSSLNSPPPISGGSNKQISKFVGLLFGVITFVIALL